MDLVDVAPDDRRLTADVLPVLLELRPHLTGESLAEIYSDGYEQGLRFTAAYEDGRCVGVAGWRIIATTVAGRKLYVDDLVTASGFRSRGVGAAMMRDLEARARDAGCRAVDLDSGVERHDAHRFYFREGMAITSHHFVRRL